MKTPTKINVLYIHFLKETRKHSKRIDEFGSVQLRNNDRQLAE